MELQGHFRGDARSAARAIGWALAVALGISAAVGCGKEPPEQYNRPADLTSIGPVTYDQSARAVVVDYTLRDPDGDDQTIYVGLCPAGNLPDDRCPAPVEAAPSDGLTSLTTVPEGEDVTHRFAWNVGCGSVDEGSCKAAKLDRDYAFRIRLDGSDQRAVSGSFSLSGTFGLSEIPDCDKSVVPESNPCSSM